MTPRTQSGSVRNLALAATLLSLACSALQARAQTAAASPSAAQTTVSHTPAPPPPDMPPVQGHEFDRIIAVVNGDVILDSDVDEERRFNSIQPYRDTATDFTRDKAIERLINRDLILQQARLQPEDAFTDADVQKEITGLRKTIPECKQFACDTDAGWQRFLASHGFTVETFTTRWRLRMEALRFIEERFRMGVRITPGEIKDYYEKNMLPEYAKQHVAPPKLETISERIQEVLLQRQVSNLLGDWLKSLRAQGSVAVLKEGEVAP